MDSKNIVERFKTGIEKGKEAGASNWFTKSVDKGKTWTGGLALGALAEDMGEEVSNKPELIVNEITEATAEFVQDRGTDTTQKTSDMLFSLVVDKENDNMWTRIKKRFFSVALSFGSFVTAFIGVKYAEKYTGLEFGKDTRTWLQKMLALFSADALAPELFPETA